MSIPEMIAVLSRYGPLALILLQRLARLLEADGPPAEHPRVSAAAPDDERVARIEAHLKSAISEVRGV